MMSSCGLCLRSGGGILFSAVKVERKNIHSLLASMNDVMTCAYCSTVGLRTNSSVLHYCG